MGRSTFQLLLFVLISLAGAVGVRRAVLSQQTRSVEGEAPFLMESALQFRMTRMVKETGTLPEIDHKVQVPDGVVMRETYSVGAEWVYAALAEMLPSEWTFTSRVRWVSTALFCLSVVFAGLWARQLSGSIWSAWITAGILACSPAFAVRSSGLELSRENLAVPLFTLFLWLESCVRRSDTVRRRWILSAVAAVALALAQCVWDLTQMVTGLWVLWCWIRVLRKPETAKEDLIPMGCVAMALVAAAVWNPYLRSHGSFFSPVMAMVLARAAGSFRYPPLTKRKTQVLLLTGSVTLFWILGHLFAENYSHFSELLFAKIRYLNVKPMDPSALSYAQRIMWTPALNSTTWELTKAYFLFTLVIYAITLVMVVPGKRRVDPSMGVVLFSSLFTFPLTILFFRFHVFWVLFAAVWIGAGFMVSLRNLSGLRRFVCCALLFVFLTGGELTLLLFFEPSTSSDPSPEQAHLLQLINAMGGSTPSGKPTRWGRPGAYYEELETLAEQLRQLPEGSPVLANFGISASILAESELPILLHPKFETPGIRERVRRFYEHLFLGSEQSLRAWAVGLGARYYVHSNGHLSDLDIRNSPRYMVDALEPPEDAPVRLFEDQPHTATFFQPIGGNRRYRIFRIITPEDEEFASSFTALARQALQAGDLETAKRRARQALSYHWKYPPAQEILATILSL